MKKCLWMKCFKEDYEKLCGKKYSRVGAFFRIIYNFRIRYLFFGRMSCSDNYFLKKIGKYKLRRYEKKYGLEIKFNNIGPGFLIIHPFNITVNAKAVIKGNCTIFKGATIGSIRSGKRKGVPTLEDGVVLCINSVVVGNVHIGKDVLFAPNSYCNFDVPDHSIVIGNPGVIHHKENAINDYLSGV